MWQIPLLSLTVLLLISLSGCTLVQDSLAGIQTPLNISPADKCNSLCTELGYENWSLLALVEQPGEFECKCTFLDCQDTESNGAIIRTCTPTSDIYPLN